MPSPDFEALAQGGIRRLRAYDPGHDIVALRRKFPGGALVELGSNESPFGPSPRAVQAVSDCVASLHRYPDPLGSELKSALATHLQVDPARLMLGNGSHELLMMVAQVFAGPDAGVVASEFGFAVYAIAAQAAGAKFVRAPALPLGSAMPRGHDLDAIAAAVDADTQLVYLANPNNPSATWFSTAALATFLESVRSDVLVVVDEAYLEFVTSPELVSAVGLLDRFPNLIVTRTFSKAHGLAGLRVGYACAHPDLVAVLERVRESFNVGTPGLAAATASLADSVHLDSVRSANAAERDWLANQLRLRGARVGPSQTNFVLVDFERDATAIEASLVRKGIVLRPMAGYGLGNCLRITVGARGDNLQLLDALDQVLS
ncbi:MAG: histidinol-phosphate transaminase [Gammaproteobacteria bacterium RIFCSPHIGHO2_12_FULL_63_22]|nr:MAG: histidinol-phosphate transaminase [Gammaproteobacteria bacterium RIFCSPHIGHO2_12_FULL_63_22]